MLLKDLVATLEDVGIYGMACNWIITGKRLGYPKCCTMAMIKRDLEDDLGAISDIELSFDGTGFVPCPYHNSVNAAYVLAEIYKTRPFMFPITDDNAEFLTKLVDAEPSDAEWDYVDSFLLELANMYEVLNATKY